MGRSHKRDPRIHGVVLDESNPAPTLRELLREWELWARTEGLKTTGSLMERTQRCLDWIGEDGKAR